jgi:2-polyprenyl-3-methyl-5-hydroxy-6-metoxy-1,4-benzoquinol methylase
MSIETTDRNIKNLAYKDNNRDLKEHEKRMVDIINNNIDNNVSVDILDIGCADGLFMEELSKTLGYCNRIDGIDNDPELVFNAKRRHYASTDSFIHLDDCFQLTKKNNFLESNKYDVIVLSGLFEFFDYGKRDNLVKGCASHLKDNGKLFIFSSLNSKPVDLCYRIRPSDKKEWDSEERFILSIEKNNSILKKYLSIISTERFFMPFDLPEKDSPFSTYSIKLKNDKRMIISKFNVVAEQYFIVCEKSI